MIVISPWLCDSAVKKKNPVMTVAPERAASG
jgi:hypothetical protein